MRISNLDTYSFLLDRLSEEDIETLSEFHSKVRISIAVLKYLFERNKMLKSWDHTKDAKLAAAKEGVSRGKVYRAIKSRKKHKI